MLWFESPTNPILSVYDIKKITTICKEKGVLTTFDNTIPTPYLLNPVDLGIDIILHSGTKFLAGHSDILMGFVSTNHDALYNRMKELYPRKKLLFKFLEYGACPSPFDCYLLLRGLKTLPLRVEKAQENAKKLAEFLYKCPQVETVFYPGLLSHPGYEIQKNQARGPGAIISFRLKNA